jgi:hypothetical protein
MRADFDRRMSTPVTVDLADVQIPTGQVLKRLGYPSTSYELQEPIRGIFNDALLEAGELIRMRGVYRTLAVASNADGEVGLEGVDFRIHSKKVARLLGGSPYAVLFAVTAGRILDEAISERMRKNDMLEATLLDAIGSETADAAADMLHWKRIGEAVKAAGGVVTPRFSPGYGDWPVTVQNEWIPLCGGDRIGISVTPSSLMIPRKSVSAVFGIRPA